MEKIINFYYDDSAKRLRALVDQVLYKLHLTHIDREDFYSLANEVFVHAIQDYDSFVPFDIFLQSCLRKRFCTELRDRTRAKRCAKRKVKEKDAFGNMVVKEKVIPDESLDAYISEEEEVTLGDRIPGGFPVEEEGYSEKMLLYLNRLSSLQRQVLRMNTEGYLPWEIKQILGISDGQYADCYAAIRSYRNVSVLL